MDDDTLRKRRRAEALSERLHEQVEQVSPEAWSVPSRSDPSESHLVVLNEQGVLVCDCPGAKAGRPCRHVEATALARQLWELGLRNRVPSTRKSWYSPPRPLKRVELV